MRIWTEKEIEFLKKNYRELKYNEVAERLNRSIGSIYWKCFDLNLKKGRWSESNRWTQEKILKRLNWYHKKFGYSPSVREVDIPLKSACQRHFSSFNKAKKAAKLEIRKYLNTLPKSAYRPTKELAYIMGVLIGDGSFRFQKSIERTSYVIFFGTKDRDLMDYFISNFKKWSHYTPNISVSKGGRKKFPDGKFHNYKKNWVVQIGFKEAWGFLKKFNDNPLYCLNFFPKEYWKHILKGLWDAEGCIREIDGHIRIVFVNSEQKILNLFKSILERYNLTYSVRISENGCTYIEILGGNFYKLKFLNLINSVTIKRKLTPEINRRLYSWKVYEMVKQIPYGKVSTYSSIAKAVGSPKARRAVGQALKSNKNPLVPCHRVIKSSGELGGFRGKETLEKARILRSEGIRIKNNRIELERHLWKP